MARLSKEARPDSVGLKAVPALLLTAFFAFGLSPTNFSLSIDRGEHEVSTTRVSGWVQQATIALSV